MKDPYADGSRYFPELRVLFRFLNFSMRIAAFAFGLVFMCAPLYGIVKFLVPLITDPFRTQGERFGAGAFALFGIVFTALGAVIFRIAFYKEVPPKSRGPEPLIPVEKMRDLTRRSLNKKTLGFSENHGGGYRLTSANLYQVMAGMTGLFTVVWNGIVFFSFWDLRRLPTGGSLFQLAMLLPFLVVGLSMLYIFVKLLFSLRQPVVEITVPAKVYAIGSQVRVEVRLHDPKHLTKRFSIALRKRRLVPDSELEQLQTEPWIVEERILADRSASELDGDWSDSFTFEIGESPGEWAQWALETCAETGRGIPLFLSASFPFERET